MEPAVRETVVRWLTDEVGNAGSRTHEYGLRAKRAIQSARERVARVVGANPDEILFTSGATEANNLAILGLVPYGEGKSRRHIISTAIEHKAVLEPLEELERRGFEVTLVRPGHSGEVSAAAVYDALRPDTLLVSVMQANNETGVLQPTHEIAALLEGHDAYYHVDAAQGYGKDFASLRSKRIDLISVSSHKIYGPQGVGALVARRRGFKKPPLTPLFFGGGQERSLRPGTLPVPLIIGFGVAAERAMVDHETRRSRCLAIRRTALTALKRLEVRFHGNPTRVLPHVINFSVPGIDSEAFMIALKDIVACSNGSACTSQSYEPSHVLKAMNLPGDAIAGAIRLSWCHMTPEVNWPRIIERTRSIT